MYNADAKMPLSGAVFDVIRESALGFSDSLAVLIDLGLVAESAACELAHCATSN